MEELTIYVVANKNDKNFNECFMQAYRQYKQVPTGVKRNPVRPNIYAVNAAKRKYGRISEETALKLAVDVIDVTFNYDFE